ncbi:uncharacterized protein LOC108604995 [Drosophila busckii]|uniref:uncharacterized protein LOC108604995 n=1 Tax=Drosophila busckii TaxID=30019 RepID=UPI001432EF4F|nr:uncharacterized protein LOC108604995 [Drosophila busckii]
MTKVEKTKEWSRSQICLPKDNLKTEGLLRAQRHVMVSTIETCDVPSGMSWLLGMEYGRIWLRDRNEFLQKLADSVKSKVIMHDYEWWLKQRNTNKCASGR